MQKRGLLLLFAVFLVGCSSDPLVDLGDKVEFDYTLSLEDGTVVDTSIETLALQKGIYDSSKEYGPAEETIGKNTLAPKVEQAMIGMEYKESKRIELSAEEAFGQWTNDPDITFASSRIEGEIKKNALIYVSDENGIRTPYYVTQVDGDQISVNKNHPLAGKNVVYEITITWIYKPTP